MYLVKRVGRHTAVVDVENANEKQEKKLEECDQGEQGRKKQAHPAYCLAKEKKLKEQKFSQFYVVSFFYL